MGKNRIIEKNGTASWRLRGGNPGFSAYWELHEASVSWGLPWAFGSGSDMTADGDICSLQVQSNSHCSEDKPPN